MNGRESIFGNIAPTCIDGVIRGFAYADMVIGCFDLNGMKSLTQEMERQGVGDVPMYHLNTYDQAFVAEAGALFDGDVVTVPFRPFEAAGGSKGIADYLRWTESGGHQPAEAGMVGWINADLAAEDPATHGYRQECYAFVEIRGGKFQIFGGTADRPFVCWPNKDRSWSMPTPTSFG